MAREIPEVVRAAAGLAATVLDEARKLPETLPGIPVRLIGLAMQQAMKVQQHYAGLVARGDELFTGLRGENEPGLATFDDDLEPVPATRPSNGYRESAFDRADDPSTTIDETTVDEATFTDAAVEELPADPAADAVTAVVDDLADRIETGQQSIEDLAQQAPAIEEILDEIAIDELVDQAPTLEETAPVTPGAKAPKPSKTPKATKAPKTSAAPAPAPADDPAPADQTTTDGAAPAAVEAVTPSPAAPGTGPAPVDGYDGFSIAQLRGRLRGYALSTVQDLVAYETATRAREPYLQLLRNRLEKLEQQAAESSPLAPRGA